VPEPTTAPRVRKPRAGARPPGAGEGAEPPVSPPAVAPSHLGKYELLFEIGRGGMGSVHLARTRDEHGVERLIALKCLPKERATKEALAALTAEARITATINHPNVVDTFEFGIDGGSAFLAMRLVEGVSLSRAIDRARELGERVPPHLAAWLVLQAARGLGAAHGFGIVHRDVSPANLLVSREGRLYVVDFGIAKLLANDIRTVSGVIKGKFAYMSPEQTRGSDVDARSDLFSLGVVLYELVTGVSPFLAGNPAESIYRINHVDPPDARSLTPDLPDATAAIVRRCLARAADDRFASAAELCEALRGAAKASGEAVDESDVAAWIERIAGDDLRALRERIADASRRPVTPSARAATSEPPALPATVDVPRERAARPWLLAGLIVAATAAIGVTLAVTRGPTGATGSAAPAPTADGTSAPTATSIEAPSAEVASAAPLATAIPLADTSALASSAPRAVAPPATTSALVEPQRPRPAPSAAPSVAPAKSSHKGEPFRTLGG